MDSTPAYDLSYEYDQLGNRTKTTDNVTGRYILYAYDTVPECRSEQYPTNNNRLLWYAIFDQPGGEVCPEGGIAHGGRPIPGPIYEPPEPPEPDPVRMVWYTYYQDGNAANITIRDAADPHVRKDLSLCYNGNGTLWLAIWDEWELEWSPGLERYVYKSASYERTKAREFRFDTPRARYLARDLDVINLQVTADPDDMSLWTDYLGEVPVLDYQLDYVDEWHTTVTERRAYLAGFGAQAYQDLPAGETFYVHGDMIGSSVLTTDVAGTAGDAFAYTAFGEPIGPGGVGVPPANGPRYRYAGAWGYEGDLLELQGPDASLPPIALLHVGWRWYQPSIGRFIQRDPIGLEGGANLYAYADGSPLDTIDPDGTFSWVRFVVDVSLAVARKVALDATGNPAPVSTAWIRPLVSCLESAPDIVRIKIGVDHRRRTVLEGKGDINENLDEYDRGHGRRVKPRLRLED